MNSNFRPNLFIVGGQKCGTTALAHFLSQHPEICLAEGKEAHVFDNPDFLDEKGHVCITRDMLDKAYQAKFTHANDERYLCDATPIYAYWQPILSALAHYQPEAKLIFMLRDPVERAMSHYTMERSRGLENRTMLQAFLREGGRLKKAQSNYHWNSPLRTHSYLDRGLFSRQWESITHYFKEENILLMHNDELRYQHQKALARVFQFLEIQDVDIPAESVFTGRYTSPSLAQRLAKLYARAKLFQEQRFVRQFSPKFPR